MTYKSVFQGSGRQTIKGDRVNKERGNHRRQVWAPYSWSLLVLLLSTTGMAPAAGSPAFGMNTAAVQDADQEYLADAIPQQFDIWALDQRTNRQRFAEVRAARSDFEQRSVAAVSGANVISATDQDLVRNWVGQVLLAEMTMLNPDVQNRLGELRQDLFRKYIRPTTNDTTRNFLLNSVLLPKVLDVAGKNYHPAARVNAAIILGMLDTQEGISGQRPPRPSMRALGELLRLIDDPQSPEYLVAACLGGVQRHAEIDGQMPARERMAPQAREAVVDSMLRLLAKYEQRQTEDQPGYVLSRRAIQTLAGLQLPAADPKVSSVKAAAWKVANNADAGRWLQLDALITLGGLPQDDPVVYLERLGQLVALVSKGERSRMLNAQKMLQIDALIKDKTGMAEAKMQRSSDDGLPVGGPTADKGESQRMTVDDGGGRPGGGGGGGMDLSGFDDSGLFPYHMHYVRTNVKLVAAAAQRVLGTQTRATRGLKFQLEGNNEALMLLDRLDNELKELLKTTDIGLVEEKPLTEAQRRVMTRQELFLWEQSDSVRILAGLGKSVEALEKLVGNVQIPASAGIPEVSAEELAAADAMGDPDAAGLEDAADQATNANEDVDDLDDDDQEEDETENETENETGGETGNQSDDQS